MDTQNKKCTNRMTANNKCKKSSKSKEKKEEEKKNEDNKKLEEKEESKLEAKINVNSITNNNNSYNIYVINNYFEEKKNNFNKNFPIEKQKDRKRYDRKGVEIKKGGKQKLTFIDKIGKRKLIETIPIESFKEYNLIEEVNEDRKKQLLLYLLKL